MPRCIAVFFSCLALTWIALPTHAQTNPVRFEQGNLVIEGIPPIPKRVSERLKQYQNTRAASFRAWHPTGEAMLIGTRFGNTSQIHRLNAPLGARKQLTFFDEPISFAKYHPSGTSFVFTRDTSGNEDYRIFLFNETSGVISDLSKESGRHTSPLFNLDGTRLAWSFVGRGSDQYKIVLAWGAGYKERRSFKFGKGFWAPLDWSDDSTKLLLVRGISNSDSELHILDIASGNITQINPSAEKIMYRNGAFTPDGQSIYTISSEGSEYRNIYRYTVSTGSKENLTTDVNWDVVDMDLTNDGKFIVYAINENGSSRIEILSTSNGRKLPSPKLPVGIASNLKFSPDGQQLTYTFNSADTPGNIFIYDRRKKRSVLWTDSEVGGLNTDTFVTPVQFSYPTFDQVDGAPRQIPAYIYRPSGDGPHPVIVYIHGGPTSQFKPSFITSFQHWAVDLGIAVVAPNVRGSIGYGKSYSDLDNGKNREDSVKDIGALLDWIETQPDLDKNRIVVYGGSYGGYMVLASLVHYNDRLSGGISSVGISNWVTFLENTSAYRRDNRRAEYGDERDPAMRRFLQGISPLSHATKISKPLLIIQGLNDPRVPVTESEQLLSAIRKNGGAAWYLMAKDEGHGFRKKENKDYRSAAISLFLQEHLGVQ